jgi:hypothetical protein
VRATGGGAFSGAGVIARLLVAALLLVPGAEAQSAAASDRSGACFWVEGRLSLGEGTPGIRIWPKGSRRLLGVMTAAGDTEAEAVLPPNVWRALRTREDRRIWGRFRVCPLAPHKAGTMRPVRVVAARALVSAP